MLSLKELKILSYKQRKNILKSVFEGNGGHIGGCYSIIDCLTYMYDRIIRYSSSLINDENRDRLIFSKGHSCLALYWSLVERGFFNKKILLNYGKNGSLLSGHPEVGKVPGIEITSGSLGHGPSIGVGMALSSKLKKMSFNTFVIVGDGELNEGSVWEAFMCAAQLQLNNYYLIVDNNKMESLDKTNNIMSIEPIANKLNAFGFKVLEINGHNFKELDKAFNLMLKTKSIKPKAIVLNTIKSCGISFMEGDPKWHYRAPSKEEYFQAIKELESKIDEKCI